MGFINAGLINEIVLGIFNNDHNRLDWSSNTVLKDDFHNRVCNFINKEFSNCRNKIGIT